MRTPPLMLTDLIYAVQPRWWHRVMRLVGIPEALFHDFLEGFCPCEAFADNEAEYAALEEGIGVAQIAEMMAV